MVEIWKDIDNYDGYYAVSSIGRVRSNNRHVISGKIIKRIFGKVLKQGLSKGAYLTVSLWKEGVGKTYRVHRLVATAFLGSRIRKYCVNHKDGDKLNNRLDNLEWASYMENNYHKIFVLGKSNVGVKNGRAKLSVKDVNSIRKLLETTPKPSDESIAVRFNVSRKTVFNIKNNKTWGHLKEGFS